MALLWRQLAKVLDALRGISFRRSRQMKLLEALDRTDAAQRNLADAIERIDARNAYDQTQRFRRDLLLLLGRVENIEFNLEKLMSRHSLSYDIIAPQGAQDYNEYAYWMLERHKNENVLRLCEYMASLSDEQCKDAHFLEKNLIPRVGLAKGELGGSGWYHAWPAEIDFLRSGSLQMIQMPSQVAPYLAWLANNATSVKAYLEIGVYRGGSFVLFAEWLRRFSPPLKRVVCVDPIRPSPTINAYFDYLKQMAPDIETKYIQNYSTSESFHLFVKKLSPDLVFIDGDHSYQSTKHDFDLIKEDAKIIAFHDIVDPPSPGPVQLWKEIKKEFANKYEWVEFTKTYPSWLQNMGIGVLKLRPPPV
jgi:predicted O-methyltransferase YrrM